VVAEVEALLEGRMLERYRDGGLTVPPWAVVNSLAHAPISKLRAMAQGARTQHPATRDAALGPLAAGVLAGGPDPEDVVALQRELLVPVELVLLGRGGSAGVTVRELEKMLEALLLSRLELREHRGSTDG
jgi:hypothetical protein